MLFALVGCGEDPEIGPLDPDTEKPVPDPDPDPNPDPDPSGPHIINGIQTKNGKPNGTIPAVSISSIFELGAEYTITEVVSNFNKDWEAFVSLDMNSNVLVNLENRELKGNVSSVVGSVGDVPNLHIFGTAPGDSTIVGKVKIKALHTDGTLLSDSLLIHIVTNVKLPTKEDNYSVSAAGYVWADRNLGALLPDGGEYEYSRNFSNNRAHPDYSDVTTKLNIGGAYYQLDRGVDICADLTLGGLPWRTPTGTNTSGELFELMSNIRYSKARIFFISDDESKGAFIPLVGSRAEPDEFAGFLMSKESLTAGPYNMVAASHDNGKSTLRVEASGNWTNALSMRCISGSVVNLPTTYVVEAIQTGTPNGTIEAIPINDIINLGDNFPQGFTITKVLSSFNKGWDAFISTKEVDKTLVNVAESKLGSGNPSSISYESSKTPYLHIFGTAPGDPSIIGQISVTGQFVDGRSKTVVRSVEIRTTAVLSSAKNNHSIFAANLFWADRNVGASQDASYATLKNYTNETNHPDNKSSEKESISGLYVRHNNSPDPCGAFSIGGVDNWRLPSGSNIDGELKSLIDKGIIRHSKRRVFILDEAEIVEPVGTFLQLSGISTDANATYSYFMSSQKSSTSPYYLSVAADNVNGAGVKMDVNSSLSTGISVRCVRGLDYADVSFAGSDKSFKVELDGFVPNNPNDLSSVNGLGASVIKTHTGPLNGYFPIKVTALYPNLTITVSSDFRSDLAFVVNNANPSMSLTSNGTNPNPSSFTTKNQTTTFKLGYYRLAPGDDFSGKITINITGEAGGYPVNYTEVIPVRLYSSCVLPTATEHYSVKIGSYYWADRNAGAALPNGSLHTKSPNYSGVFGHFDNVSANKNNTLGVHVFQPFVNVVKAHCTNYRLGGRSNWISPAPNDITSMRGYIRVSRGRAYISDYNTIEKKGIGVFLPLSNNAGSETHYLSTAISSSGGISPTWHVTTLGLSLNGIRLFVIANSSHGGYLRCVRAS